MENVLAQKNDKKFGRLYAFISLLLICFYLVTELVFELWYRVAANYGLFLIISFIALSFFVRFYSSTKEEKCLVLYAIWVLITRVLNGDRFLDAEFYFLVRTVLFTECFICVGFVLDREDRKRFFDLVCAIVCGYWFILAVAGLYATVNLTRIAFPPADMTVGLATVGPNKQLTVENIHRNVSGVWFALAAVLMIYQFLTCKRKIWRIPITIAAIAFYFATAMSFCRAAQVGLCVAVAMMFILLALERMSQKSKKLKTLVAVGIIVVVIPLCYLGYGGATGLCSALSSRLTEEPEQVQSIENVSLQSHSSKSSFEPELISDEKTEDSKETFSEGRGKESVMMLGGRTYLWKAGVLTLAEEPGRLIKGGMLNNYMERVVVICNELANRTVPDVNSQMHNYLLDSLLLTGVPGALILLAFTVFLVLRMVKVFFSNEPSVTLQLKLMTLPVAFLLVDNMMEAHIFRYAIMPSILFFLICGLFLAWSYEVLPRAKKK